MPVAALIALAGITYLALLFAIAFYADGRARSGRSLIANPTVYALSLGVYATSWTFYGSVGRAAVNGVGFLPTYLGPTLVAAVFWLVLRKIVRISRTHRITSIADFIAARYGKSAKLAGVVTLIAVIGIVPYIALQLKAVSGSFLLLAHYPDLAAPTRGTVPVLSDTALYVALLLALFAILFGARHLDASERHEGMVAAIAFESLVKLAAFVGIGIYVSFVLFDGLPDLFGRAAADPKLASLLVPFDGPVGVDGTGPAGSYASWFWLLVLSGFAILCLPRQFQIAVVENVDEAHIAKASWLFPAYMLVINLFVLPIALGGLLRFADGSVDSDTFVLALPISMHQPYLALLVFLGGLSAATGMVIVETVALSTMVCNDVVMPLLLRARRAPFGASSDLSRLLLPIRRSSIVAIVLLGYAYFRFAGEAYALVSIGFISFAAVAQFAPAMLGGLYWKQATGSGAMAGLIAGFVVWAYTLLLPSFARSGWLPHEFVENGPWGLGLLRPQALFGLTGMDQITHAMVWSMLANCGALVCLSLFSRAPPEERAQAERFVEVFRRGTAWTRNVAGDLPVEGLRRLLARFVGTDRAAGVMNDYARTRGLEPEQLRTDASLLQFVETQLAGAIGSASARAVVSSAIKDEGFGFEEVMSILDETSQVMAYSRELEVKRRELEHATSELRTANERLQELDRMKDDFVSTVSHELRTPLTAIRAFAEILHHSPDTPVAKRAQFVDIILRETERLTRLIDQILDLARMESGRAEWTAEPIDPSEIVREAAAATEGLFRTRAVRLQLTIPPRIPTVLADRDRMTQVLLNLLTNAVKFCTPGTGLVQLAMTVTDQNMLCVQIRDNGVGIAPELQATIFEKFRQVNKQATDQGRGFGLGLPISRLIVRQFGGDLWVESRPGHGACFSFTLPIAQDKPAGAI
jgi:Na+/proline symporter/nitrogen-specific signal transduction histidine kinase